MALLYLYPCNRYPGKARPILPDGGPTTIHRTGLIHQAQQMNSIFKTLIAGYGAKKLGGGCISTVVIFLIIYALLGHCN